VYSEQLRFSSGSDKQAINREYPEHVVLLTTSAGVNVTEFSKIAAFPGETIVMLHTTFAAQKQVLILSEENSYVELHTGHALHAGG
jgi:hypothetical protein